MHRILTPLLFLLLLCSGLFAQEEYFGKNKVQYKDFDWSYIQSPNFDVYFYENEYELAKFAVSVLESAYVEVSDELNYSLRGRIPVFLYNSPNEFQQTNVTSSLLPEGVGGFTESFKNRVVVPFNGSYEDLRHVLHHELTHAVTFDWLYGDAFGSLVSRQYLFDLPLWLAEGYAEYSSRDGWDYQADMVMRDATINSYLQPLEYLGGYLAYKQGQALVKYIVERYGEEKLHEIISRGRASLNIERALQGSIGMSQRELFEDFSIHYKRIYWPELASRKEPAEFAKRLTNHEKDGSYFNEMPAFSPDGKRIAIFSDRSDYTEIYLISAVDGRRLKRLVRAERSGDLESLHSYVSGMTWSPDGNSIAFVAKSHGFDALFIYDLEDDDVVKKLRPRYNSLYSPVWGPNNRIAVTGVRAGQADIYLVDVETDEWEQITDDRYDDKDVSFSPDGAKIAFASDRPLEKDGPGEFNYGVYNIYTYDLGSGEIATVTTQNGICRYPQWSPDGSKLCFTSNINGIDNLYIKDLDSRGDPYPITNVLTGIKSPSWSPDGEKIAFSSFHKAGYDIYVLKDIKPVTDDRQPLPPTAYVSGEMDAEYVGAVLADAEEAEEDNADTTAAKEPEEEESTPPVPDGSDDFVFSPPTEDRVPPGPRAKGELDEQPEDDGRDTLYAPLPSGEYEVKDYKVKFTPDLVAGGVSYDAFYGLRGQSLILISDYLGNHQFFIFTDLVNSINQSNLTAVYLNSTKRLDFGAGIFHNKNYFVDPFNRLFSDRTYGVMASAWYPFSMFRRVQLDLSHTYIDRTYYDPPYDDSNTEATLLDLSLVHDNVLWGYTGPVNGSRWKISWERSVPITSASRSYWATELDYRKYWHIGGSYLFAMRFTGGASFGTDKKTYFVGGTTNYIGSVDNNPDAYTVQGFYFSKIITPLRGYDYFEITGSKYAVINAEFRYPFLDYFKMSFPLPLVISRVSGAMFLDVGAAWNRNEEFKGATTIGGDPHLQGIKSGFGLGARVNLGIFLLRYDVAWPHTISHVGGPKHYFSFGADF
jgi:Tol biopolymer transport system component